MANERRGFSLRVSDSGHAAYLRLPNHPGSLSGSRVSKTVQLINLLGPYEGPELIFDFGPDGDLIGVEILIDEDIDADGEV